MAEELAVTEIDKPLLPKFNALKWKTAHLQKLENWEQEQYKDKNMTIIILFELSGNVYHQCME